MGRPSMGKHRQATRVKMWVLSVRENLIVWLITLTLASSWLQSSRPLFAPTGRVPRFGRLRPFFGCVLVRHDVLGRTVLGFTGVCGYVVTRRLWRMLWRAPSLTLA